MASTWIFVGYFHPKASHASTSSGQTPRSANVDTWCSVMCSSPYTATIALAMIWCWQWRIQKKYVGRDWSIREFKFMVSYIRLTLKFYITGTSKLCNLNRCIHKYPTIQQSRWYGRPYCAANQSSWEVTYTLHQTDDSSPMFSLVVGIGVPLLKLE